MSRKENKKESILNYVENFIDKRDNELRSESDDENDDQFTRGVDRDRITIRTDGTDFEHETLVCIFYTNFSIYVSFFFQTG